MPKKNRSIGRLAFSLFLFIFLALAISVNSRVRAITPDFDLPVYQNSFARGFQQGGPFITGTTSMAVHPTTGKIYIAEEFNNFIRIFNTDGSYDSFFSLPTVNSKPTDLAFNQDGSKLFVLNGQHSKVDVISTVGTPAPLTSFGSPGSGNGQFTKLFGLAFNKDFSELYIYESGADPNFENRVQVFEQDGTFLREWTTNSYAPDSIEAPLGITVTSIGGEDVVAVLDGDLYAVRFFKGDGSAFTPDNLSGYGKGESPEGFSGVSDALFSPNGDIFILADGLRYRTLFYSFPELELIGQIGGTYGTNDDQFQYVRGLALNADNSKLFISDSNIARVNEYSISFPVPAPPDEDNNNQPGAPSGGGSNNTSTTPKPPKTGVIVGSSLIIFATLLMIYALIYEAEARRQDNQDNS